MSKRIGLLSPDNVGNSTLNPSRATPNQRSKPFGNEVGHLGAIQALPHPSSKALLLSMQRNNKTQMITEPPHKVAYNSTMRPPDETQSKKNISIKLADSPSTDQKSVANLTTQLKSLSTRHSDFSCVEPKVPPLMPGSGIAVPNYDPSKCSAKRNGIVRAYAANTNQGLVRNYNEDRVSIILNILKPPSRQDEPWPKCSFFGVYDGHGGSACADYLRDNLHQFVIREPTFPWNPREALRKGLENAEKKFLELAQAGGTITEKSGSCAVVTLIVGDMCYVSNVGDSRAVLSGYFLSKAKPNRIEKEEVAFMH